VAPLAIGICAILWLLVVVVSGYVSLGSVLAAVAFPIVAWIVDRNDPWVAGAGLALSALILYTHRTNIRRLIDGTESRIGHRRKEA
jgi:glycerol-3-phosphate acyltransferase PlsY